MEYVKYRCPDNYKSFWDKSNIKEIVCSYFVLLFHRIVIIYVIKRLKGRKGIFAKI